MPRNSWRVRLPQNETSARQRRGQPRSRTSSCGRPNGKSKPPTQGPASSKSISKLLKSYRGFISNTSSEDRKKVETQTVMGFARLGAQVKSTPRTLISLRAFGELRGRKVVDAAKAGDEARIARHDAPEGEIRELEVDLLLGEAR